MIWLVLAIGNFENGNIVGFYLLVFDLWVGYGGQLWISGKVVGICLGMRLWRSKMGFGGVDEAVWIR